ncbi:hypothetical protein QUF90_14315 [Desulfococcaceae bacterium HSG9]|nr:hypothetical protein [Desulfococcaceae bacterium HSG9]
MNIDPIKILRDSIKLVPSLKYALGIAGIVSVLSIISALKVDYKIALFGTIIMLVLMVLLVIFAKLSTLENEIKKPAVVFLWFSIIIIMIISSLLISSVFFKTPVNLRYWLDNSKKVEKVNGNIRVTIDGNYIGPLQYKKLKLLGIARVYETTTDINGNFVFYLADDEVLSQAKLQIEYDSKTYDFFASSIHFKNLSIEISKTTSDGETKLCYKKLGDSYHHLQNISYGNTLALEEYEHATLNATGTQSIQYVNKIGELSYKLGSADSSIINFFRIIGEKDLAKGDLYSNLIEIAYKYNNLQQNTGVYANFDRLEIASLKKKYDNIKNLYFNIVPFNNEEEVIYLVADTPYAYSGDLFTLDVRLSKASGVAACAFTVNYPIDFLEPIIDKTESPFIVKNPKDEDIKDIYELINENDLETSKFYNNFNNFGAQNRLGQYFANFSIPGKILFAGSCIELSPNNLGGGRFGNHITLLSIAFRIKNEIPSGIIQIDLQPTIIDNPLAGYTEPTPLPVLIGAYPMGTPQYVNINEAYPILLDSFPKNINPMTTIIIDNRKKERANQSFNRTPAPSAFVPGAVAG